MRPGSLVIALAVASTLAVPATAANAQGGGMQIPQKFENLKVLPKDIPRDTLISVMRGFAMSLGVRCTYCHVETHDAAGAERILWASDDKPAKEKARVMMRMVGRINGELLPTVPDRHKPPVNVNCLTCHRTMPVPQTLVQVLDSAMVASGSAGADSSIALYRRLRASDGTRGRWDFGEGTLSEYARELTTRGKVADAVLIAELNAEQNPNSAQADVQLAELYRQKGDKDKAIARYRMALTKQPNNQMAKRRLEELEKQ